ncbi:oligosaccharide flippase family protein [Shewanella sp. ISTPL2]|uniref:oligosaccharide flippase family protein n=1 Tax=Shewanella sp. ISTPL2 TaxID=2699425 RepID=UPI001568C262|nr:oligosaccharide flippase family protein [Shewanella sp. ISTPL2]
MMFKKILSYSFGPIGGALFSFITLPLIANFFSVEDLGRFSILQVSIAIGVMLFSLGLDQAFVREYHECDNKPDLFRFMMLPNVIFFPLLILIFCFTPVTTLLLDFDDDISSVLIAMSLCLFMLNNQLGYLFRMEERGFVYSLTILVPRVTLFIFILMTVYVFKIFEFRYLIYSFFLSVLSSTLVMLFFVDKGVFNILKLNFDLNMLKKMLSFGLPLIISGLAYTGLTTLDRYVLKSLSTLHEVGVYAVALGFASVTGIFSSIFSSMWHPLVYRWVNEGVKMPKIIMSIECMTLFLSFVWSLLGMFSFILVYFVPDDYQFLNYLFMACVGVPLIYMLSEVTQVGIGISRRTSFSILASVVSLLLNVILNILLIPDFGASGAAIATLISFVIFFMVRTESSVFLWQSFPRIRVYVILFQYVSLSILFQFYHVSFLTSTLLWSVLFLISLFLFKARVRFIYHMLLGNLKVS